jgi:hypothetical protein
MVIKYRPDLLPFTKPHCIGLPYHGLVKSSKLLLPNNTSITYPQPEGGSTILVRGQNRPTIATTQDDIEQGKQRLSYAYMSGIKKLIGGEEIDPNKVWDIKSMGSDAEWDTHKNGKWIYNDGKISWIMKWEAYDAEYYFPGYFGPATVTKVKITIEKPFGYFSEKYKNPVWEPNIIFDDYVDTILNEQYGGYGFFDPYYVSSTHDQYGKKTLLNFAYVFPTRAAEVWLQYYCILGWTYLEQLNMWTLTCLSNNGYFLFELEGVGSTNPSYPAGSGITIKSHLTDYHVASLDHDEFLKTLSPEGEVLTFRQYNYPGVYMDTPSGNLSFYTDCGDVYCNTKAPYIGTQFYDGSYIRAWNGAIDNYTAVHIQGGSSCFKGVSYDIAKNQWSTQIGTCYV